MERADYLRQAMLLSATLALTVAGCALPPELGFASRSDNLLHSLLQGETTAAEASSKEAPAAVVAKEVSPYPTALKPGTIVGPLQQSAPPVAMQLDRNKLAGRLPYQIPHPATIHKASPPPEPRPEQQASYTPEPEYHPPEGAVATVTLQPTPPSESSWPAASPATATAQPLEIWNQFVVGPVAKPITTDAHSTAGLAERGRQLAVERAQHQQPAEPAAPHPFVPPTFTEPPSPSDQPAAATQVAANGPAEKPAPEPIDHLLDRLIVSLEEEIRQKSDRKETDQLPALKQKLRLLQLIADRTDDAVDQIEQLPPAEREAFKQLMFALTTWLSPDDARRSSLRNAKILRALTEVEDRLSAVSKLDLKNLTFCEKVESFGWYTEFPRAEFTPKQQVILYVEVQNFAAEEKTATAFETELAGSYQIFDAAGNIVDEHQLPLDKEVCRNFRRDYFLAYRMHLPPDIGPGRYRLELSVEDLKAKKDFKGKKQGEAMIEFAIK